MSAEPIRKEATGRYVVVVDIAVPGERRKQLKRRFTTYREARVWLGTTRAKVEAGSFVRPQRMTLAEWVDEWLPVLRTQVRRQTYESYERNLRLHVLPTLGARPMQSIKAAELTTLYARLLSQRSGRPPGWRGPLRAVRGLPGNHPWQVPGGCGARRAHR